MGKKVCFNCGASNLEDAKFCYKCGSELDSDNYNLDDKLYEDNNSLEVVEKTSKFCSKCGAKLEDDDKFCSNCGESTDGSINDNLIHCPKCGSTQIGFVRYENNQQYDVCNGICGLAICGPLGLLCGIKNKQEAKTVRKCQKCNHEF